MAAFHHSGVDMEVRYGGWQSAGGSLVFITLAHAETQCTEQRVCFVGWLFGGGLRGKHALVLPGQGRLEAVCARNSFAGTRAVQYSWVTDESLVLFDNGFLADPPEEPRIPAPDVLGAGRNPQPADEDAERLGFNIIRL